MDGMSHDGMACLGVISVNHCVVGWANRVFARVCSDLSCVLVLRLFTCSFVDMPISVGNCHLFFSGHK